MTTITYSGVLDLLMEKGGLKKRQATLLLTANCPRPIKHRLHSRRLWLTTEVEAFCSNKENILKALEVTAEKPPNDQHQATASTKL